MALRPRPPARLALRPRSPVLRSLEGELARTARRLERLDPRPQPYGDEALRPVLRLLAPAPRPGDAGLHPA
jgi:hypothetical protein